MCIYIYLHRRYTQIYNTYRVTLHPASSHSAHPHGLRPRPEMHWLLVWVPVYVPVKAQRNAAAGQPMRSCFPRKNFMKHWDLPLGLRAWKWDSKTIQE